MKRKFENRKTVSVHLEEAEYKWLELQAEGNISDWCRERLLADYKAEVTGADLAARVEATDRMLRQNLENVSAKVEPLSKKRYCHHGLAFCKTCLELEGMSKAASG